MTRATTLAVLCGLLATTAGAGGIQAPPPRGVAYAVVELPGGQVVQSHDLERVQRPTAPGSFVKVATLVAALASGVASPDTRVPCAGEAVVSGHTIRCSHPRLRHPLRPAEALALSCNVWFATIGQRLPRARLDGVLTALGLPPTPVRSPMALAAAGLQARPSPPISWTTALARVLGEPPAVALTPEARAVVVDGLRGAALYGTAAAFSERGLDVAAKTGTAELSGGGPIGVVVAAWPVRSPRKAIVLVAAGVAGKDAADLAAATVSGADPARSAPANTQTTTTPAVVRVGTVRAGGAPSVETLPMDDYVARVLAGEAVAGSPPAALEALALAVRTFAVRNRSRHAREGFDLCPTTHCQVLRDSYPAARNAAVATSGRVLLDGGAVADVYYTASCGGHTEKPSNVWRASADPAYLPIARDRACDGEPRWVSEIPVQDLERALQGAGYTGRLRRLSVDGRTGSGRAARVELDGMRPDAIAGQDLRMIVGRALGWQLLKSTLFSVKRTGNGYRFEGQGFGHGVGLCVLGSAKRAERGGSARDIVGAYFPGLAIGPMPSVAGPSLAEAPPARATAPAAHVAPAPAAAAATVIPPAAATPKVQVLVPPSAEPERAAIAEFARRWLSAISAATGRTAPSGITIVFHPSAESFRRETGESWWISGRTRGTRIDLLPIPVLRSNGTLETTLKHELAHLLTSPALDGRAEWVKEGVAMHFAGEPPPSSLTSDSRRVRCPDDDQLRKPLSASTARAAYAMAAACVAREMGRGVAWTDIR
jgi:stage II sporulation protein D